MTKRANQKQNKDSILRSGMNSYATYGAESPFTYRFSETQLRELDGEHLLKSIKQLHQYEHRVYYYGQFSADKAERLIRNHHKVATDLLPPPAPKKFAELAHDRNQVFFTHFLWCRMTSC